uniref:Integrase, catalytic region, zinc finger, CCHC-type, peptidase aspartic, catalytic n=1 Tax=Tanacetum cinerariifolium TaxID=118510 RepID=A0A6L2M4N2_TANCI|nr:hypothetical protein [Tanacetum cinerariifolium]
MLAEALESGVVLDEEKMAYLADNRDTVIIGQASQEIPTPAAFQTDELDAFNSDCDEALSTIVVLMAKLSSYDSVVLSKVPTDDNYLDNHVIDLNEQETKMRVLGGFEHIRKGFEKDVKPFVNTLKDYFQMFDKGVISSTCASGSKPPSNTKKNRILQKTSCNKKNNVEDRQRSVKPSLNKKNRVSEPVCNENVKHSSLNVNYELICATCNKCMFDAIHDLCVLDYLNDVNVRIKSKSVKSKKKKVWKPTGKVFTNVGYRWKPTGRNFTIDGNTCQLTMITSTTVVPPKKPFSSTVDKKIHPLVIIQENLRT